MATDPARDAEDARRRAERRAWIRATHPDAGGDPAAFVRGLADFDHGPHPIGALDRRPTVRRSRRPDRIVQRALRSFTRRLRGQPPRRLR
jgi:hypothetical protein